MKLSIFLAILIALLGIAFISAAAPLIGVGYGEDFLLYQLVGVHRAPAFKIAMALTFLFCTYQALSIGIAATPRLPKWRAVLQAGWIEGTSTFTQLSGQPTSRIRDRHWQEVAVLAAIFAVAFVSLRFPTIFLPKYRIDFLVNIDQIWFQTFVDYDLDWRTPLFSFAGNVLNNFGIQLPLNTQLLPILGLSQLFAHDQHIPAAVVLGFIALALLFWAIGAAWGLPPVSRAVFAGVVALIITVPQGLDFIFCLLPPNWFTRQFQFALWWQEAIILFLVTVVFFYWIGHGKSAVTNILYGVGFALGCFLAVLGYPVGGIYFVPLIVVYCLVFFFSSVARAEWMWKGAICAAVAVVLLAAKVPQFFANLYAYSFGSYFRDLFKSTPLELFLGTFMMTWWQDFRGFVIFAVSIAIVVIVAFRGKGALRRFAIAILVCDAAIIAIGSVNELIFRVPIVLAYADIAQSPLWVAYFVLGCMSLAVVIDRRLAMLPDIASGRVAPPLRYVIKHRRTICATALAAVWFAIAILLPRYSTGSTYPPAQPSIVKLLEREVAVAPGAPFRGRVLTTIIGEDNDVTDLKSWRTLGNDLSVALLPFGIPTVQEYLHWTSPVTFAFLRAFFGHDRDPFYKNYFPLTAYDPKIARLMGVRIVVSNAELSDGVLLYEQMAEDSDVRIYRLDDINLGQFSPTQLVRVSTAAEAIAAMKAANFDPRRDVVIEDELMADLVPAESASIAVDAGPDLHIRAASHGHSLLVLPFEFSHCLRLHARAGTSARLLPVNLQQTGLLFDGQTEVSIEYRYGLFGDAQCRGADLDRANTLHLRELVSCQATRPGHPVFGRAC